MAVLTYNPTSPLTLGGTIYPNLSGKDIAISNAVGVSSQITSITVDDSHFTLNTYNVTSTTLGTNNNNKTATITLSTNWSDPYFDGTPTGTISLVVSGQWSLSTVPALSTVSFSVSNYFDGLEWPSDTTDPSGFQYDSPQDHARLYINGEI